MAQDIPALQGIDVVLYARKLSAAKTEPGHLIRNVTVTIL